MSEPKLPIHDQHYDGIVEDDNPLPGWWKWILYISTVFAFFYMLHYHTDIMMRGTSARESLAFQMETLKARQDSVRALKPPFLLKDMVTALTEPSQIESGKSIFTVRCIACHSVGGAGNIGPNLTDNFWIHGGRIDSIAYTIQNGVAAKGMPTWGNLLSDEQIKSVAVYVKSLKGSNPPNPKAPQGVLDTL